jgi:hypothetical protein
MEFSPDFREHLALPVLPKKKVREDFTFVPSALTWGHTLLFYFLSGIFLIPSSSLIAFSQDT